MKLVFNALNGVKRVALFLGSMALLSACFSGVSHAYTIDEVQKILAAPKVVEAKFEQTRVLKNVKKPLKSSGVMLMVRDAGLVWDQQEPFKMAMLLNNERMVQKIGKSIHEVTKEGNPQFFEFSSDLRALMFADRKALEENFKVEFKDDKTSWTLNLEPKLAPLNKIFAKIVVNGDEVVNKVELFDKQQDATTIIFSDHVLSNELSQEDKNIIESF